MNMPNSCPSCGSDFTGSYIAGSTTVVAYIAGDQWVFLCGDCGHTVETLPVAEEANA